VAEAEGVVQGVAEVVAVVHREGVGVAVPPARQAALAVKEGLPVGEAVKVPPPPRFKTMFCGGEGVLPMEMGRVTEGESVFAAVAVSLGVAVAEAVEVERKPL
jgi:hypothetical protein